MSDAGSELDRLDPEPVEVKLSGGYAVLLQRLKTRQFFRLLKVLTRGLGPIMVQAQLDFSGNQEEFGRRLLGMLVMAIPEAEQPFIEFIQSMVLPVGMHEVHPPQRLGKQETEDNQALFTEMLEELNNPELEDLLELAEAIVRQEAPEIQALGKKVQAWMEMARKTGLLTPPETTSDSPSSARSQRRSTSSRANTGGRTTRSSTSRSAGSGSA